MATLVSLFAYPQVLNAIPLTLFPDMFNMLYDAATNRITALLDYDLAHVATPADEYFCSLRGFGFLVIGPFEDDADENQLRKCLLEGFEGNAPPSADDGGTPKTGGGFSWAVAKAMDEALSRAGVLRPADIAGCGELAALKWFLEDVSPPYFYMPRWLEKRGPAKVDEMHASIAKNLDRYLRIWGF